MSILKTRLVLCCIFTLSFIVSLLIATLFSYELQKLEQEDFATEVLESAETVTSQLVTVLSTSNKLPNFQCTKSNINKLRELVQQNTEIFDAGYIIDNTVYCTANWGAIEPTEIQAQRLGEQNGYQFYSDETNLYHITQRYNITVKGNFFAVNITTPYSFQLKKLPVYHFKIYSSVSDFVFDTYSPKVSSSSFLSLVLETNICSDHYGYCVKTVNSNAGLTFYSLRTKLIVFLIVLTFCYLITHLAKLVLANRQTIEARFRKALVDGSLFMEYQPIVNIQNGKIEAVESLVRWTDEVYGRVSPDLFINIAEKLSLYPDLAHFTAKRSINEIAPILRKDPTFALCINIGSYEILDDEFLSFLDHVVTKTAVNPNQIKIEITERINVDLCSLADFSDRARSLGFMVVLDDFGTGVSNLVWLTEVNFDYIKIDRVFVNALNFDIKKGMASAIMDLVASLGKDVVFEGVETEREYNMIKEHCFTGYVQGWYFYRSLPLDELLTVLQNKSCI
ncbi:EAL domain-containing protein [Vibrio ziniensis]|uniref:cyclic-guanylate-specific phosphodiesterase n=1 Tax=Vibrio ziniensis TaxID=2711221 RepID=A0A6G7CPW1_9VIBR|nr:EAL domain-containing protein [Vibrio ziniensis]QIH44119.1 EAL domain-containing protein [Vibrio ziniensis]